MGADEFLGGAGGDLISGAALESPYLADVARHGAFLDVLLSGFPRMSSTTRWTNTPGRCTSSGSISPTSTTSFGLDDGDPAGHRRVGLKFLAAAWKTQLPCRSATAALTRA